MTKYVLFGSPTCMPCKTIKGILPTLGFEFDYVDVFEQPELAGEHMIMSTPTMIKFEEDEKVATVIGQGDIMAFVSSEQN
ncbi:thioredoxin family protein [Staphylococcus saprophyticus]|uniref:thioredoxin family protein n=1 Tax=Staphylococcus saprophyticus TaxID=29385 RepID=UPI0024C46E4B|nr:thioredoxin family protein [Staphylococcus saprophyticus]MDK1672787.1 thioredoxin family protein [Staphylococcus saprophyticus]